MQPRLKSVYKYSDKVRSMKFWIILDSLTKIQSQPLSLDKLQSTIQKMTEKDMTRYYIWTEGWQNWQSLQEFLNSDNRKIIFPKELKEETKEKSITKSMTNISTEPETQTTFKVVDQEFDGSLLENLPLKNTTTVDLNFKKLVQHYNRRAERHEFKIEVLLINLKGKSFRSYSKNISLTGTLLEDHVPFDFYGNTFDLVVVHKKSSDPLISRVQLKAETVGDGITQRIRFVQQSDDQKNKLKMLLNDYVQQQPKLKKTA